MNKTMLIHEALAELKMLDKRITSKIGNTSFMAANKASNTIIGGMTIEDFKAHTASELESIQDLIEYRKAIKRAITKSNATTEVTIAGVKYTVAEAIWMKNEGVQFDAMIHDKLAHQFDIAKRNCDMENQLVEDKARKYAEEMFPSTAEVKDREKMIAQAMDDYRKKISFSIVSGVDYLSEIETLEKKIDAFESEVDSALSVSNATTTIEVEW